MHAFALVTDTDVRRYATLSAMPPLLLLMMLLVLLLPSLTHQEMVILGDGIGYYNVTSFTDSDIGQLREVGNLHGPPEVVVNWSW